MPNIEKLTFASGAASVKVGSLLTSDAFGQVLRPQSRAGWLHRGQSALSLRLLQWLPIVRQMRRR